MDASNRASFLKESGAPHSKLTEDQVMVRTLLAMCIPAIAAIFAMGTQATYNILVAVVTALVCHYILQAYDLKLSWRLRESTYSSPYSPLVAGLIVGLCVGELSPFYVTAFISALTVVLFKWGQEKVFGRKIVNPAAGAKALVLLTLTAMWMLPEPLVAGQLFYPSHLQYALYTREGFAGAMELAEQVGFYGTENLSVFWSLILWKAHGWIGGASGLAVVVSGILLAYWIKLKWRITVSFLGIMAILAVLMGVLTGGDILLRFAFHVFTGSVIFLAFYMATEPQTTPASLEGQYYFGAVLAVLTMVGQLGGLFGASFIALAVLNPFAPYFDRVALPDSVGKSLREYSPFWGTHTAPDFSSPVISYDADKCIACSQCIKACEEIQGKGVLGYGSRGRTIVVTAGLGQLGATECDACGECVQICPAGALHERRDAPPVRTWDGETTVSTCPYCGVGCQIEIFSKRDEIGKVHGADAAPNYASLCVRGRFEHSRVGAGERLTRPLLRQNRRLEPVSWSRALTEVAERLEHIKREYGPDGIGGVSSAGITNEGNYLFQKFMRVAVGTNNVDIRAKANHVSTIAGLNAAFGCSAMTNTLEELEHADCILLPPGADIVQSHPVAATIIKRAVREHGAELIVFDPRRTDLAPWASIWLKPEYGTDAAWLNGMMNVIHDEGLHDQEFIERRAERYSDLVEVVQGYTPHKVEELTGIPAEQLRRAAEMYAGAESASIVYSQHDRGADTVVSLANLALLTGNVGKSSAGVNPLVLGSNFQGACDMGTLPDMLPGYQDIRERENREKFAEEWQREVPAEPGLGFQDMVEAAAAGDLRAMLIMGSNPLVSGPDPARVESALEQLDCLVVFDRTLTETAAKADVVLPITALAEEDGTFTSSERRIRRVRRAVDGPDSVQPIWQIVCALSDKLGYSMECSGPSAIMDEIAELSPIYRGVSYPDLEYEGIHWPSRRTGDPREDYLSPYRSVEHPELQEEDISRPARVNYLYRDEFPRGRARFNPVEFEPFTAPDEEYPLVLSAGRMMFEGGLGSLRQHWADRRAEDEFNLVEIHPSDAEELGIAEGDRVQITSRYGEVELTAMVTDRVSPGLPFVPLYVDSAPPMFLGDGASEEEASVRRAVACRIEKAETITIGGVIGVSET